MIANFPLMFFSVVMGLGGLNLALERFFIFSNLNQAFIDFFAYFNLSIFIIISLFYLAKSIFYFSKVKGEFTHPIKINFISTIPISMLILASLFNNIILFYDVFFYTALIIQTYLSFFVISFWINHNLDIKHSNPAYFIPIVGNLIIVLVAKQDYFWLWCFFGVAVFFWLILFSIIFYRILFHEQLPLKFMPTLFIMIAPPSVAFLDYVKLTKNLDFFASMLLGIAIFFVGLIIFMYKNFLKLKFFISWWAFTFPSATASLAFFKAYELNKEIFFYYLGTFTLLMLILMVIIVSFYTIKNIINKSVFEE
ncbi:MULTISPECIES: SLAC1 anion channel family protein [unclassified Campylobacter]|uniref:SLAC1 anion channel family protein n=1 Tax=unclassified Campylobacter TaxID=2593542 RepID=UPI001238095A|nr:MULTISPECIES: SLAC1 anion channel family protein [unclassified Campylobacter]KAA6225002.1 C4-dicarboxylate ABC transporter [Campylobacter sp. LR196d]KAA6225324.1 C4-dicarboxylate ABC transporter [Campylobacter sp. LR286c]KAA6225557.1 C4-dicarboxylate ABC transporter [Campylobacter sp. LR185c]KAA8604853.1 C4-dicarboxylate ABC transporter [Campylobacter sp. LR185c]